MGKKRPNGKGDCYVVAGRLVGFDDFPGVVCHGWPTGLGGEARGIRFGHAWVESGDMVFDFSNGGSHVMRREDYYELGRIDPDEVKRYGKVAVLANSVRTGHWGPDGWKEV